MSGHQSHGPRQSLSPDDLAVVVKAFEAGLSAAGDATLGPHQFRHRLARLVLDAAFAGEPDPRKLEAEAIGFAKRPKE